MRAAVFKTLGQPLSVEEVTDPVPGAQDVLIKVGRCGSARYQSDLKIDIQRHP